MAKIPDLAPPARKRPTPKPAPPTTTKQEQQVAGTGGSTGLSQDANGNFIDPTTGAPFDASVQQILQNTASASTDPNVAAATTFLDGLRAPGTLTPEQVLHGETPRPADPNALAAWQKRLSDAGLLPNGYTQGYLDQPTINATVQIATFGNANQIADMNIALGDLQGAYQAVGGAGGAAGRGSADPGLLAAERALRKAQLPLDWNDLNRRIQEQPILDADLKRRIAEQPILDAELARRQAEQPLLDADLKRKQEAEKALAQKTANTLLADAREKWWVPLSQQAALDWGTRIAGGQASEEDFTAWAQSQAKALFPQIGTFIDRGAQTSTLMDPYLQIAAKELDKNPQTLVGDTRIFGPNFMDLNGNLPDTNTYLQKLRTLPEWRTTTSANNLANDWTAKLSETFGGVSGIATGPLTQP